MIMCVARLLAGLAAPCSLTLEFPDLAAVAQIWSSPIHLGSSPNPTRCWVAEPNPVLGKEGASKWRRLEGEQRKKKLIMVVE
ncbi:hypothetical protein SLEP1_g22301 [Rubroshorea leprosula]|uniref:Secreted protein n=1 Tax=Rubroshorea leprosula TaxID=152421 RepID=A0AAV5JHL1_9ROSI|nr:hypothetical protein SLEP1_g22301 [Rubroshorea leprosula]